MKDLIKLAKGVSKFVVGLEGNISGKSENGFYVKASGKSLNNLSKKDLVFCDINGKTDDISLKPSIEVSFHAWLLYNLDIKFVAHTHPVNTLKILCSNELDEFSRNRIFPDQVVFNGRESCVVDYSHPGEDLTDSIKKSVTEYLLKYKISPKLILLKNHGIITLGNTINDCIIATEICEKSAEIFIGCRLLSKINYLSDKDITNILEDDKEKYRQNINE